MPGPTLQERLVAGRMQGPFDAQATLLHDLVGCDLALVAVLHEGRQHNIGIGPGPDAAPRDPRGEDAVPDDVWGPWDDGTVLRIDEAATGSTHRDDPATGARATRGWLAAPFRLPDASTIGTVCVHRRQAAPWETWEVRALLAVRDHVERLVLQAVDELSGLQDLGPTLRHELGGSLAIIEAAVETALLPIENDTRTSVLRRARYHSRRLASILDALLALGPRAPVRVTETTVADVLRRLPDVDGGRVRCEVPPGLTIRCEATLLERLLANLVENALKYTDGPVHVIADTHDGRVRVRVVDHGSGLPVDADVFAAFVRGSGASAGFGFGLHLVRRLALRLGADLEVDSDDGGTTFTVLVGELVAAPAND